MADRIWIEFWNGQLGRNGNEIYQGTGFRVCKEAWFWDRFVHLQTFPAFSSFSLTQAGCLLPCISVLRSILLVFCGRVPWGPKELVKSTTTWHSGAGISD